MGNTTKVLVNGKERKNLHVKEIVFHFGEPGEEKVTWRFNRENLRVKEGDEVKIYHKDYLLLDVLVKKSKGKIEFLEQGKLQLNRIA
jgi:hypothetical protein